MTIGYEGLSQHLFFDALRASGVQTIVDVRELPLSRKRGFSKSALAGTAASYEMTYVHLGELGCPRPIRYDYKADRDWDRYVRRFTAYLDTQNVAIAHLATRIKRERCCLVCYEADYNACHRTLVAERVVHLLDGSVCITHLRPQVLKSAALVDSSADEADKTSPQ